MDESARKRKAEEEHQAFGRKTEAAVASEGEEKETSDDEKAAQSNQEDRAGACRSSRNRRKCVSLTDKTPAAGIQQDFQRA